MPKAIDNKFGGITLNNDIIISSDSTTDLSPELKERYQIRTIPLGITLGGETYRDGIDITPDEIYANHDKTGELPKTTATNVGECADYFAELTKDGKSVIHFTISSDMSSTYSNACIAANDYDNVYVIDSRNLSTGGGLLVLAAAEMAYSGMRASEIAQKCKELTGYVDASFVIDSLEYLYKGGRCSALSMLGANLLKLKPCIEVRNGVMGVGKKYRGKYKEVLLQYVDEILSNPDDIVGNHAFITHAGCSDDVVDAVLEGVKSHGIFKEVFVTRAGCTVSSHCGANTLGVLFIRKTPVK